MVRKRLEQAWAVGVLLSLLGSVAAADVVGLGTDWDGDLIGHTPPALASGNTLPPVNAEQPHGAPTGLSTRTPARDCRPLDQAAATDPAVATRETRTLAEAAPAPSVSATRLRLPTLTAVRTGLYALAAVITSQLLRFKMS